MVDLADARVLAVLTRAPSSGGKSRLFTGLGIPSDPRLLEALLLDTIDGATAPGMRIVVAVTPGSACDEIRAMLRDADLSSVAVEVIPQAEGDLGERMRGVMEALFARGAAAVALIGSDLPHITSSPITAAFDVLADDRDALVLGPAADGGYYLVAAARVPDVFTGIEWGTARVLEQTQRVARDRGIPVRLLPVIVDVDTADELRRVVATGEAPRTSAWIRDGLK